MKDIIENTVESGTFECFPPLEGCNDLLQNTHKQALFLLCSYEFVIRCQGLNIWKSEDDKCKD